MSCLTCHHFIEVVEECDIALAPQRRPPARVIAYGCPRWTNTTDAVLEHHARSGNLSFTAKPVPAPASRPASTSYTPIKTPSQDAYDRIPPDDIPF